MSNTVWIDSNVLLRHLTGDPPAMAEQSRLLMESAERGDVVIKLSPIVVAESCWVLESFYEYDRQRITEVLSAFVRADGVDSEERDVVLEALANYAEKGVDFVDAYLAAHARAVGPARICTFDARHFHRLEVELLSPEAAATP